MDRPQLHSLPQPIPPFCAGAHQRSGDTASESYEVLLRDAHSPEEQLALACVLELTAQAKPPRRTVPLAAVIDELVDIHNLDQWTARYALAMLDKRKALRLVGDGSGDVQVSIGAVRLAEVLS